MSRGVFVTSRQDGSCGVDGWQRVFEHHEMRSSRKRGKMRWLTYQTWEIATPVCLDVNHGQAASGALLPKTQMRS
jgi:hypothetical protein